MAGIGNNTQGYENYKSTRTRSEIFDITGHPGYWAHAETLTKNVTYELTGSRGNCAGIMLTHSDGAVAGTVLDFTGGGSITGVGLTVGTIYEFSLKKAIIHNGTNAGAVVFYSNKQPLGSDS